MIPVYKNILKRIRMRQIGQFFFRNCRNIKMSLCVLGIQVNTDMSTELSPQIQNQVAQIQQVQQQAQALSVQKSQTEVLMKETQMALEELEKTKDDAVVYKSVGELMIRSDKAALLADLKEKTETLSLRMQSIERQEERLNSRFKQLQEQLRHMMNPEEE